MSEKKPVEDFEPLKKISASQREERWKQKGVTLWFTGLPGSGKTTLSTSLEKILFERGYLVYRLDGDIVRRRLSSDLTFTPEDRSENIRRVGEVARLITDASFFVCVALISPFQRDRDRIRNSMEPGRFIEIYLDCSLEVCEKRDIKGLYKKARNGEIKEFTGISSPYEPPLSPEIHLHTALKSPQECVEEIIVYLTEKHLN